MCLVLVPISVLPGIPTQPGCRCYRRLQPSACRSSGERDEGNGLALSLSPNLGAVDPPAGAAPGTLLWHSGGVMMDHEPVPHPAFERCSWPGWRY